MLNGAIMKVLVTSGAGYIGSMTATALEEYGNGPSSYVVITRVLDR